MRGITAAISVFVLIGFDASAEPRVARNASGSVVAVTGFASQPGCLADEDQGTIREVTRNPDGTVGQIDLGSRGRPRIVNAPDLGEVVSASRRAEAAPPSLNC